MNIMLHEIYSIFLIPITVTQKVTMGVRKQLVQVGLQRQQHKGSQTLLKHHVRRTKAGVTVQSPQPKSPNCEWCLVFHQFHGVRVKLDGGSHEENHRILNWALPMPGWVTAGHSQGFASPMTDTSIPTNIYKRSVCTYPQKACTKILLTTLLTIVSKGKQPINWRMNW